MKTLLTALALAAVACSPAIAAEPKGETAKALAFKMKNLDGKEVKLADYKGKVVLIVNVASKCGLTDSNYKGLQELHEKYAKKGLAIVGFPCNQFGGQEPGTAKDISTFCTDKYGVEFDMFAKVDVNGDKACDLYKHLTALDLEPKGKGKVSWNFEKFLLDREGKPVARFEPRTKPTSDDVIEAVEKLLAKK